MFIIKKNYYIYIDNTKSIDLNLIKHSSKFTIIYRNFLFDENIKEMILFTRKCRQRNIKFYIANNYIIAKKCKADGLYLSSFNRKIYHNIDIIGAAHNYKEINQKIKQKCRMIIVSRLFKTTYKNKKSFFGISRFNLMVKNYNIEIAPLGGIKYNNLLKMKLISSNSFAIMSEIKKKPAILSRLF